MNNMTRIISFLVLFNCLYSVSSNLISSTKKAAETSTLSFENDLLNDHKVNEKTKDFFDANKSSVYLEGVLYSLKNQDWTNEEVPCLNRTLILLQNLQNFTLWSVWEWDSMSSQPLGLLYGSQYHLGNFDECLNPPWRETHPELRSKYCLANVVLERTDKQVKKKKIQNDPYQSALQLIETKSVFGREIKKLTWGMCVPVECRGRSVERLTQTLLAHTHLGTAGLRAQISVNDECQSVYFDKRSYNGLFYAFICLILILTLISILCTFVTERRNNENNGIGGSIMKAFDLRSNVKNLLKVNDELQVFYGLKCLSMCVVVIGHQVGMFNSGPISNGVNIDEDSVSLVGALLMHDDVVVDTFFMISGFLTAASITKLKKLPNLLVVILKRYIRLVTPYALVIFYVIAVYPYTGTGPLWNRAVAADTVKCQENWWLSLLMMSNYINAQNACIVISWYIPCDFHFFVVSLLLYWFYRRFPTVGKVLACIITIAAIVMPGISTYKNEFPPIHAFTFEFVTSPRGSKQFHELYIKSHMRYAAYIIGFFAGFMYVRPRLIQHIKKLSQKWLTVITYVSVLAMIMMTYLGTVLFWMENDVVVNAVYASLDRPLWALGLSLIVLCCSVGHVPFVKSILSWHVWVPLSRLTYGVYLVHSLLITRNIFVTRNLQHQDYFILATSCAGILFWSYMAALYLWLIAEAPVGNLTALLLGRRSNIVKADQTITRQHTQDRNNGVHDNQGYLEENLPPSVHIISSKF